MHGKSDQLLSTTLPTTWTVKSVLTREDSDENEIQTVCGLSYQSGA